MNKRSKRKKNISFRYKKPNDLRSRRNIVEFFSLIRTSRQVRQERTICSSKIFGFVVLFQKKWIRNYSSLYFSSSVSSSVGLTQVEWIYEILAIAAMMMIKLIPVPTTTIRRMTKRLISKVKQKKRKNTKIESNFYPFLFCSRWKTIDSKLSRKWWRSESISRSISSFILRSKKSHERSEEKVRWKIQFRQSFISFRLDTKKNVNVFFILDIVQI